MLSRNSVYGNPIRGTSSLTCNSSGNSHLQSSQLAEPLWTDPLPKRVELIHTSWSSLRTNKQHMGNDHAEIYHIVPISTITTLKHHTASITNLQVLLVHHIDLIWMIMWNTVLCRRTVVNVNRHVRRVRDWMKFVVSCDTIFSGWLGSKHQLTN